MTERCKKLFMFCFLSFSLLNLTACSKKSYFDIYVERLERLLGETIQEPRTPVLSVFPRQVVVSQQKSMTSIGLLEFLALSPCELQLIIAQRNSALGKVSFGSQKLINELLFLNLAQECLDQLGAKYQDLKAKIQEAFLEKKRNLPTTIAQATLGGPEYKEMWSRSVGNFFYDTKGILALNYIRNQSENWLGGNYHLEGLELEENLSILRSAPLAEYMHQMLRTSYYLQKLTLLIEEESRRGGFCEEGIITDKGIILKNVVEAYFTKASSDEINIASRGSSAFLNEIQKLNQLFSNVLSDGYKDFFADQFLALSQSRKIFLEHSAALEPVIFGCTS